METNDLSGHVSMVANITRHNTRQTDNNVDVDDDDDDDDYEEDDVDAERYINIHHRYVTFRYPSASLIRKDRTHTQMYTRLDLGPDLDSSVRSHPSMLL